VKALLLLVCMFSLGFSATDREKLEQLQEVNAKISALAESGAGEKIAPLQHSIVRIKNSLKNHPGNSRALLASKSTESLSADFDLLDFKMYSWTDNSNRIVVRIKNRSLEYAEWVKLYFYFYQNNTLVSDDYTYIDFSSYGNYGVLPYYESFLESFVDKVAFDSLHIDISYNKESGEGHFLCDQLLQHISTTLTPSYSGFDWDGVVANTSTYSLDFPQIHATVFRQDSLIDVDYTFLDTECQGNRTVIIDYVIDEPIESQKIVLRNCSDALINLNNWYLGDRTSPYAYQIPEGETIDANDYKTFTRNDITFTIDDDNEIIYLFDSFKSLIDQWTKEENDFILQPLTSCCYDSYLDLAEPYDKIKYQFSYSLHSLSGQGNIAPNAPAFRRNNFELAPNSEYNFQLYLIDGNQDDIEVQIDWGNDQRSGWLGPYASKSLATADHAFATEGEYWISAQAKDSNGSVSSWSDSIHVFVSQTVPVELANFSGVVIGEKVTLHWTTVSETNNLGFAIERSQDRNCWRQIGFANGRGTIVEQIKYTFTDASPLSGASYYRLRQVDFDGSETLSKIIAIQLAKPTGPTLSAAYPNPFNSMTRFTYELPETMSVDISIYSINGVLKQTIFHDTQEAGSHDLVWCADSSPSGVYIVSLRAGRHTKKVKCLLLK
jgi:hypothetical protein